MKKESKQKDLILECRYYNGEEENPFAQELMQTIQQKSDNISKAVSQLQDLLKGIEE